MDIDIRLVVVLIIILFLSISARARYELKKLLRIALYENFLVRSLRSKILQLVLPGFSGAYFLCLDVWGDKWAFIKDYQPQHEFAFSVLIGASLIVLIIRGIADHVEEKVKINHSLFIDNFTSLTSKAVATKLKRFKEQATKLKPNGNTFKSITQPKEQINLILSELVDILRRNFGIQNDEQCITIMHQDPKTQKWHFKYQTNASWQHTKPEVLLAKNSTASECLNYGEPIFHPDKVEAEKNRKYFMSDRDKEKGNGSAFCYPVVTKNKDYEDKYIISMVTYGKRLCDPFDKVQAEAIRLIFIDICRRIDLELTLESIKEWQFDYHTSSTRRTT